MPSPRTLDINMNANDQNRVIRCAFKCFNKHKNNARAATRSRCSMNKQNRVRCEEREIEQAFDVLGATSAPRGAA